MIELEIQTLSEKRDGLLIDVGRFVIENGFTLQRQRLAQGHYGTLMILVVRGPARKKRALEASLDAYERIISFKIFAFEEGQTRPHFAASHSTAAHIFAPAIAADVARIAAPAAMGSTDDQPDVSRATEVPEAVIEKTFPPEFDEAWLPDCSFASLPAPASSIVISPVPASAPPPAAPLAPAPSMDTPFVEPVAEGPDVPAVEKLLPKLANDYPQIVPRLLKFDATVTASRRESSLLLAGQLLGAWLFARDGGLDAKLELAEAIECVAVPALGALVDIENQDGQIHIRNSPICVEGEPSRCVFLSGYLEGLLAPATASKNLSIFAVCCRSYGADDCVLAISD